MAKILKMPLDITDRAAATTAPQDVLAEDAATFDVLRRMREDILCCVLKPDQRLRFGELRQRYGTSVGTLREALSHLVSEGLARTEAGRGFTVAPISLADFLDLSELRVWLETTTLADAIRHGTDAWEAEIVSSYSCSTSSPRRGRTTRSGSSANGASGTSASTIRWWRPAPHRGRCISAASCSTRRGATTG